MSLFEVLKQDEVFSPDERCVGDLALLRPTYLTDFEVFIKDKKGFEATEPLKKGLEGRVNEFFKDRGEKLIDNFPSLPLWDNFAYMVVLHDTYNKFSPDKHNYEAIQGILLAFKVKTESGFEFMLYDTIGIAQSHRKKGNLRKLLHYAEVTNKRRFTGNIDGKQRALPAGLRTSKKENDYKYARMSDYRDFVVVMGNDGASTPYYIHTFDFNDPASGKPIKAYVGKKDDVVKYIAALPPKFTEI